MNDFLGRPLAVGDHVILMVPNYRNLKLAQIEKFTLSGNDAYVRWGNDQWGVIKQKGHQLVKVEGADLTWFLLKK